MATGRITTVLMPEHKTRKIVAGRSRGICEVCNRARATDCQHRQNRSQGGKWTAQNIIHVCRPCHQWIHSNPEKATEQGLTVKSIHSPLDTPALLNTPILGKTWVKLTRQGTYKLETWKQ